MWRPLLRSPSGALNGPNKKTRSTFRGVEFATVEVEARIGRRNVPHEYPQRDLPYVEDLGRRARQFLVEAYVVGDDYMQQRDRLMEAIEQPGPGELVHPRWGTLQVSVVDYVAVRESHREGGKARFTITFCEAGENTFPQATQDTVVLVDQAATTLEDATEVNFAEQFSILGGSVLQEDALSAFQRDLAGLLPTVRRVVDVSAVGSLVQRVSTMSSTLTTLLRTPATFVQQLRSIYGDLVLAAVRPLAGFTDLQATFGNQLRPAAAIVAAARPGSTRARLLANETARTDLQRRVSLANQARSLALCLQVPAAGFAAANARMGSASTFSERTRSAAAAAAGTRLSAGAAPAAIEPGITTVAQALQLRDRLLAQIDTELEQNDPQASVANGLVLLRAAVTRDVGERVQLLKRASSFSAPVELPSLVIAHRVYQDARRADELELRNGVRHPALVAAKSLEILR